MIDDRASIDPTAKIGKDVTIGPWSLIGAKVSIGDGSVIGPHVIIEKNTKIGKRNKIYHFASIGADPQDLTYQGEQTWLEMGDENIVREYVTINRGSLRDDRLTRIGNKNCFLAYSHVAHDCIIGNEVLMVNNATIAGHVQIDDYVILGAFTAVHQFCRVGAHAFLSRATEVSKDILPYMLVAGLPGMARSLNTVGLKRRGFTDKTLSTLKKAYQIIYRRQLKMTEVKEQLKALLAEAPEIQLLLDMIETSSRGISRTSEQNNEVETV